LCFRGFLTTYLLGTGYRFHEAHYKNAGLFFYDTGLAVARARGRMGGRPAVPERRWKRRWCCTLKRRIRCGRLSSSPERRVPACTGP